MIDNRKYSIVHIIKICFLVVGWWWIILNLKRKESQHGTVSRACSWLNSSSSSSIWLLLRYGRDGNPVVERNNYRHDALIYSPYCIVCYVRQKAFVFPAAWITDLGIYVHDAQVPIPPEGKMERGGGGILSGVAMLPDVAEHDSSRPVVELWPRKEEKGKRRRAYI